MRRRPERTDVDHHLEGLAKQEVADQHARLVPPHEPRGRLAAPKIALVDHVVVEKRRGMHELDARREPDMAVALIGAELGRRDGEHGTKPLAAGIDEMAGELGDQFDIRSRAVEDDAVDMGHVLLDKRDQRGKARPGVAAAGKLNDNSQ